MYYITHDKFATFQHISEFGYYHYLYYTLRIL